jgi:GTPase SAR1 family protein
MVGETWSDEFCQVRSNDKVAVCEEVQCEMSPAFAQQLSAAEIKQMKQTRICDLSGRGLTILPREVAQLTNLQALMLGGNELTALPPEIGQLTSLEKLTLNRNKLIALPPEIGQLTSLRILTLDDNGLTALPPDIGQLTSLQTLTLMRNGLTALPPEIGHLTGLQTLTLNRNGLTALPPEIGHLTGLQTLTLNRNKLIALPPDIGQLTSLRELTLVGNWLTALPPEIGQLTSLQTLQLDRNGLTALPPEIGQLTGLQELTLVGNKLTVLPPEIAYLLDCGLNLDLAENPLKEPLPELIAQGRGALAIYLQSLHDSVAQYEAKVLLVGEGNVGKTSLSAALRDDAFIEGRPFTHGINIETLLLPHPGTRQRMTIRLWDFGGQEVYRITHQFFFSQRALYVIVWKPREGQEQNEVEGWLRRIRLRVGSVAQVLIVATHCADEKYPDLDYPQLQRQFPEMLVGNFAVDNRTGHGIAKLRKAIAKHVAKLPQMGQKISSRWIAVQNEIRELADSGPQISFDDFLDRCRLHDISDEESGTLARYMHELGQIVYYGDDEGLQDFVVLNPEWLTTAISYVLRDDPTRESGGILDHTRLRLIWHGSTGYPARYHRYFLRLMEKFDISYRLEDEQRSLIAQLVPYPRPNLPWDSRTPLSARLRRLALVCQLSEPAPGLMAWLTVRHHPAATGRHWRAGVFLRYPIAVYDSEALLELASPARLALEVRAPSPDLYFHVLRDSIETLIKSRWPGLTYQLFIPCPTVTAEGAECPQLVALDDLLAYREEGEQRYLCTKCRTRHDVSALLTGFTAEGRLLSVELSEQLTRFENRVIQIEGRAAETASVIRRVLRVVSAEVNDCPSVFTLTHDQPAGGRRLKFYQHHYRLTLWCQHPGYWHAWDQAAYEIDPPREWFLKIRPYAALIVRTLQLVVPLAGTIAVASLPLEQIEVGAARLEVMKTIVDDLPREQITEEIEVDSARVSGEMTTAEGTGLRMLRAVLFEHDSAQVFGGLRRVLTPSGDFLWICPDHYGEYDPGLPAVP